MIQNYLNFLVRLNQNNNRQWFTVNKDEYNKLKIEYLDWIEKLLFEMIKVDSSLQFLTAKDCIFRINRDIRFTKDKSPYKTHLSGFFSNSPKNGHNSGYYFEISTDSKLTIGGGQYNLLPKELFKSRQKLVEDASQFRKVLKNKEFKQTFGGLTGAQLKTHPKGFSRDTENLDLLKFNNYIALTTLDISSENDENIADIILSKFKVTKPLIDLLRKW
jgi:uncharacterized protein (TIGR02453 family)